MSRSKKPSVNKARRPPVSTAVTVKPPVVRMLVVGDLGAIRNSGTDAVIRVEGLEIDLTRRKVSRKGKDVPLSRIEYDILAFLARNVKRVITYNMILESVWGPNSINNLAMLRSHIAKLRRKVEPDPSVPCYVITERRIGYSFLSTWSR